jgi:hypothetical protein
MATPLDVLVASLDVKLQVAIGKSGTLLSPVGSLVNAASMALAFGTGLGKADLLFADRRVVAFGQDDELDLAGVLTNNYGDVLTFANVKLILIVNRTGEANASNPAHTATTAILTVGGGANEFQAFFKAAGDKLTIDTGGILLITDPTAAGWAVTATTADDFLVHNDDGANEAMYDIVLLGESA